MSLFGKVLTILNALAAVAFLVIAGMDYSARNQWSYSVFRHDLAMRGLPLDNKDDSWRPGRAIVKDVNAKTMDDLFRNAGGAPVKTQLEAVQQAKATATQFVEGAGDDAKKRAAAAAVWLPLIPHSHQRDNARKLIAEKPAGELAGIVGSLFDAVAAEIESDKSVEFKRMKVADLLYNFNPGLDPAFRERAQAVLGLDEYSKAADRQASNLYGQIGLLELRMKEESAIFARQMQDLQPKLVLLNDQLKADKLRLDQQKKLLEKHTLLFTARKAERDELAESLRKAGATADAETAQLAAVQQQLFAIQREIAAAREQNSKLESQIRTKELGK
ncbi:MAG: hypothetical protein K1X57_00535 [Gemmataceae bacterium]|nr:hypothetical protein [Gemmataceae bacterium]